MGSNPTPRTLSSIHRIGSRYIQEIEPQALSEILSFGFWMQKAGYRPSTVKTCIRSLKAVVRRANLLDPESVKGYLATAKVSVNRKQTVTEHLARFYKWKRIPFEAPHYKKVETLPFIPLESEVDQLIAGTSSKMAAFLQLIKETAARPGEAWSLRWIDLDSLRHCIRITPEKGSRPRETKVSDTLLAMLNHLPKKWALIFHDPKLDPVESLDDFRRTYDHQRRKVTDRLQNPRITQNLGPLQRVRIFALPLTHLASVRNLLVQSLKVLAKMIQVPVELLTRQEKYLLPQGGGVAGEPPRSPHVSSSR